MIATQHAGELSADNVAQMVSDISAGADAPSLTRVATG
jgi:hypothetical protein